MVKMVIQNGKNGNGEVEAEVDVIQPEGFVSVLQG
jgi:hypothetical protein